MEHPTDGGQMTSIKPQLFALIEGLSEQKCREIYEQLQAVLSKDQRKHPRAACDIPVNYATDGGLFEGLIKNISRCGVFIETRVEMGIGEAINMTFASPGRTKSIKIAGKVVRKDSHGVGVEFDAAKEGANESTWFDCRRSEGEIAEDRRLTPRVDLSCPVYLEGIHGPQTITDLSIGGVFVECDEATRHAFPVGQLITLAMKLPTEEEMVEVKARVVKHNERGMHCRFEALEGKTEDAIYYCFNLTKHTIPIK